MRFKPGIWRHYKGGLYLALFLARFSEHREVELVVYFSLSKLVFWARPYKIPLLEGDDCWCDRVEWPDGKFRPRFVPRGEV